MPGYGPGFGLSKNGLGAVLGILLNLPFMQSGAGAQQISLDAKIKQNYVSMADFAGYDPTGATSSHVALQAAISEGIASKREVLLPPSFKLSQGVNVFGRCRIVGVNTVITTTAATFDAFTISSSDVWIDGLWFENAAKIGGANYHVNSGNIALERIRIQNHIGFSSPAGFTDGGTGTVVKLELYNCYERILRGTGFNFTRQFGYLQLFDCTVDFNGAAVTANSRGFVITGTGLPVGNGGGKFQACHVLGGYDGFTFTDFNAAWFIADNTADGCTNKPYQFIRCNKLQGEFTSAQCDGAIEFTDTTYSGLKVALQGRKGIGGSPNIHGIQFKGTLNRQIQIVLESAEDVTGSFIKVDGTQAGAINIVGGICDNAGGRAADVAGTSVFQWSGFILSNCAAATFPATPNYSLGSANQFMAGVFNSGGRSSFQGPGTG